MRLEHDWSAGIPACNAAASAASNGYGRGSQRFFVLRTHAGRRPALQWSAGRDCMRSGWERSRRIILSRSFRFITPYTVTSRLRRTERRFASPRGTRPKVGVRKVQKPAREQGRYAQRCVRRHCSVLTLSPLLTRGLLHGVAIARKKCNSMRCSFDTASLSGGSASRLVSRFSRIVIKKIGQYRYLHLRQKRGHLSDSLSQFDWLESRLPDGLPRQLLIHHRSLVNKRGHDRRGLLHILRL